MAEPKMGWDPRQKRWRKLYKGVPINVKASDLGGTGRDDTMTAANREFERRKAEIDIAIAHKMGRPQEDEYKAEDEGIQAAIKFLSKNKAANPEYESVIETLKEKSARLRVTPQDLSTPPIDKRKRNPLHISEQEIHEEAEKLAFDEILEEEQEEYHQFKHCRDWLETHGFYTPQHVEGTYPEEIICLSYDDFMNGRFENDQWKDRRTAGIDIDGLKRSFQTTLDFAERYSLMDSSIDVEGLKKELSSPPKKEEKKRVLARKVMDFMNVFEMRFRAKQKLDLQRRTFEKVKKETGAIDDFTRGEITEKMKGHGLSVPKTKQLDHHIEVYKEHLFRLQTDGRMSKSRADKIRYSLAYYQKWTNISNIDKIVGKDHIDSYYWHIWENIYVKKTKAEGKITDYYGRDVWQGFLQFLHWMADEQVIAQFPSFLIRKDKKYSFNIAERSPKKIPLSDMRLMVENASLDLKLCLLLTLNCGFTQVDIGKLRVENYKRDKGRIVYKRSKTKKFEDVPTVTYLLWLETKELLDARIEYQKKKFLQWGKNEDFLILNRNGKPLWGEESPTIDEYKKRDNIRSQYWRLQKKLKERGTPVSASYKRFRKLPPSLIASRGQQFGVLYRLWLGHSAEGIAERFYVDYEDVTLDGVITWLREQLFGESVNLLEEITETDEEIIET